MAVSQPSAVKYHARNFILDQRGRNVGDHPRGRRLHVADHFMFHRGSGDHIGTPLDFAKQPGHTA
jgi:hypothetical protein